MDTQFATIVPASRLPRLLAMLNRQAAEQDCLRRLLQETQQELLATQQRLQRVTRLALHDSLTGLPNRLQFRKRLRQALDGYRTTSQDFALIYVDLDGFKAVNDVHGHSVGDLLLKIVGRRLGRALREGDSVSRHGGDEFVCLVRGVSSEAQVQGIALKLRAAIAAPCLVQGIRLCTNASFGISIYPRDGANIEALIDRADQAMLRVKRNELSPAPGDAEQRVRLQAWPAVAGRTPA